MGDVQQELKNLRGIIARVISNLETWATLHDVCRGLGLYVKDNVGNVGKGEYLRKITSATSDHSIISVAKQMLTSYPGTRSKLSGPDLQSIQDSLWWIASNGIQRISTVTRYRIAESLEGTRFWGRLDFRELFTPILPVIANGLTPTIGNDGFLYQESFSTFISLFFHQKPTEPVQMLRISVRDYLQSLGLTGWPDERFCLLMERIVHPEVQQPDIQQELVEKFNMLLQCEAYELWPEGMRGGLPVYKVRRRGAGVFGSPKYIIFASIGPKPDIVIEDAVNMDIRVVRYADQCLVYDQPPSNGDLTWQMLLEWWATLKGADPNSVDIRRGLGLRLRESLQSEPERIFFDTYFKEFRPKLGCDLPALLPQVYLHYDPRSRHERGRPVLVRQRMDFLMLLRNAARIVLEIDGVQHYADDNGVASPHRYAEMVAEDRRIRAIGYEVYRFGGGEFMTPERAYKTIVAFFEELFDRHGISQQWKMK